MSADGTTRPTGPKVEVAWLIEAGASERLRQAVPAAADAMAGMLSGCLPAFDWHVSTVTRADDSGGGTVEPVRLLDAAEVERDAGGWDFVLVVTESELASHVHPQALGVTSSVFETAILSTAFLTRTDAEDNALARRLTALALHLFGRLNGLSPDAAGDLMAPIDVPGDLDGRNRFTEAALPVLGRRLEEVADLRVEEMEGAGAGPVAFYARSLWRNRTALPGAIFRMRPWSFPLRLSRLTTAAASALAVLMMTAESWEVAANLGLPAVVVLSLLALTATSVYLLRAQRLLAPRRGPLREQRAVSNVSTVVAVALGMCVTYLSVFAVAFAMGAGLFGDALLAGWVGAGEVPGLRPHMAAFTASLSVAIGALGASFEPYGYFRHVTQVDEEV